MIDILGLTVVFGNASHDQVLKNCGDITHFLGLSDQLLYYPGARKPLDGVEQEKDGAHGEDGIAGVILGASPVAPSSMNSTEFILNTLSQHKERSVTILATGPLTNLAKAYIIAPDIMSLAKEIVVMGGATTLMRARDVPIRKGNITLTAEFNIQQAALDAKLILQDSNLPITLFPLNCTHQLTFTEQRRQMLLNDYIYRPEIGQKIVQMMSAAAELDRQKFGISPVMHDVHTALYIVNPEGYQWRRGHIFVDQSGETNFVQDAREGNVRVVEKALNPNEMFSIVRRSIIERIPTM